VLKLLDLFSGIGGFSLGLESTGGFETIAFVEKDEFCQKVLKKHWPNITIEGDIRNVKGEKYEADVITGGFPCQPFSVAGKRRGTNDDRYLWDETIRVIREGKPRWFIGENVEGLININNGVVLRQVQTDLEKEGFEVQCLVIPAAGIGAWHQRKRVWIIANSKISRTRKDEGRIWKGSRGIDGGQGTNQNVSNSNSRFSIGKNKEIQTRGTSINNGSENVSNSKGVRHRGWGGQECKIGEWSFLQGEQEGGKMGSKVKGCDGNVPNSSIKGLQGCSIQHNLEREQRSEEFTPKTSFERQQTWWQTQSKLCGVPNGVSYELDKGRINRIKALGNSIVPQIARQIALAIKEVENGKV